MKRSKLYISITLCVLVVLLSCQKKLFRHIEIHGRLINFATKQPVQAQVYLRCDDATSASSYSTAKELFGSSSTSTDGTFDIKTQASKRPRYYLDIGNTASTPFPFYIDISSQVREGHNVDLGDILTGTYTFYCKVNIIPVTSSSISFGPGGGFLNSGGIWTGIDNFNFNAGTSTQFMTHQTASIYALSNTIINYEIDYSTTLGGVSTFSTINVPITFPPDTLSVTIKY